VPSGGAAGASLPRPGGRMAQSHAKAPVLCSAPSCGCSSCNSAVKTTSVLISCCRFRRLDNSLSFYNPLQ